MSHELALFESTLGMAVWTLILTGRFRKQVSLPTGRGRQTQYVLPELQYLTQFISSSMNVKTGNRMSPKWKQLTDDVYVNASTRKIIVSIFKGKKAESWISLG